MRKLTVIRRKAFAGCLGKVKIFVEDPDGDTEINGIKCRFLGMLKNDERATFEIGTESLKIFAIYGKASKSYCNDCYIVPEGEEEYFVSGIVHLNPAAGNPFYFDGVTDEDILANRQKNGGKGTILFIVCIVIGFTLGLVLTIVL